MEPSVTNPPDRPASLASPGPAWRRLSGRLGAKLTLGVLLISSVMTCLVTATQLFLEYRHDVHVIDGRLDEIGVSSVRTISMAMWNVDVDLMLVQLQDIARLPDIKYVRLNTRTAGVIATGVMPAGATLVRRFPIVKSSQFGSMEIGDMTVVASLANVHDMLWQRLWVVLLTQALKTFVVSLFILLLVHALVTRRIGALAGYAARLSFSTFGDTVQLPAPPRPFRVSDEVDRVGDAFNAMSVNLRYERDAHQRDAQQLLFQASFDGLTRLANRSLAEDRLRQALTTRRTGEACVAVIFLDLDRFKVINDTMGHAAGDSLLIQVAGRLLACVREGSTVARFSGDEFLIILPELDGLAQVDAVIRRIELQLADAFELLGRTVFIRASMGISVYPQDGLTAVQLIKNADAAMYKAKRAGRNTHRYFTAAMDQEMDDRLAMETQLRYAMARGELSVVYQAVVDIASMRITGAEALLRWNSVELGTVSPSVFIPLAEEAGLVQELGEWVLTSVCQQLQTWRRLCGFTGSIAVNVTPLDFESARLQDFLQGLAQRYQISLDQIKLEVTERTLLQDSDQVMHAMNALHARGVRLSIDDFGTGYSSLSYLHKFPMDVVKIDQSFIHDLASNPRKAALVHGIITLSHSLGMEVVAEGVETAAQLEILRAAGCDQGQGYFLARPMDHQGFEALLRGQAALARASGA